jgi:hypothetical protein
MASNGDFESKVPFARRWHVIDQIDLAPVVSDHAGLEKLCAALERIADTLPDRPSSASVAVISDELEELLERHTPRETRLLEAMFERDLPRPLTHSLLDHIHARHISCSVQAQDVIAALRAGPETPHSVDAETLGYMLRCFFKGCRDAMAFELLSILTLAGDRLSRGAHALLVGRISATCEAA